MHVDLLLVANCHFFILELNKEYSKRKGRDHMEKKFDQFVKLPIKKMCKAISDLTYTYVNPETKQPTTVPASHYEKLLAQTVEQFLDQEIQIEMLNTVFQKLQFLQKEYEKDFVRSLLCLDLGIKPSDMGIAEQISLDLTFEKFKEEQSLQKKNFHFLDEKFLDYFKECIENKELHAAILSNDIIENTDEEQITDYYVNDDDHHFSFN